MGLELVGPRVSVDRSGTADRGGGQLVIKDGKLLVRTHSLERLLGSSIAIEQIELIDLARLQAKVSFVGGQVWNVQSEQGDDLTPFFKQVESASGREGLLRDPPRVSELVREAATPERVRVTLLTALALLAYLPLRWLGGSTTAVGGLLVGLGGVALLVGGAALMRDEGQDAPALLSRLRPWVSWPWFAAALAASLAGAMGSWDASARAARVEAQAHARAEAQQRARTAAAREQQASRERRAQGDALAKQLLDAMGHERFRDAKALYDRIQTLVPDHPVALQVRTQLERALSDLDEHERVAGVARGIVEARVVARDRLACESAKRVADSVALLRRAGPNDAGYGAARRALDGLERCRKRVRARFAQNAEESRRRLRMLAAAQVESAVRRLGYAASVSLSGSRSDVLRIRARELDGAAAQRILALRGAKDATFEAARTEEGFSRIEMRGQKFARVERLHPVSAETLSAPVLESFGLAKPLALETPPER
jgi:hypothetical protein